MPYEQNPQTPNLNKGKSENLNLEKSDDTKQVYCVSEQQVLNNNMNIEITSGIFLDNERYGIDQSGVDRPEPYILGDISKASSGAD